MGNRETLEINGDEVEMTNATRDQEEPHMAAMTVKQTKIHFPPKISSKPIRGPPSPPPPPRHPLSSFHSRPPCSSDGYQTISAQSKWQKILQKKMQLSFFVLTLRMALTAPHPQLPHRPHQRYSIKGRGNSLSPSPLCVLILPADCLVVFVKV